MMNQVIEEIERLFDVTGTKGKEFEYSFLDGSDNHDEHQAIVKHEKSTGVHWRYEVQPTSFGKCKRKVIFAHDVKGKMYILQSDGQQSTRTIDKVRGIPELIQGKFPDVSVVMILHTSREEYKEESAHVIGDYVFFHTIKKPMKKKSPVKKIEDDEPEKKPKKKYTSVDDEDDAPRFTKPEIVDESEKKPKKKYTSVDDEDDAPRIKKEIVEKRETFNRKSPKLIDESRTSISINDDLVTKLMIQICYYPCSVVVPSHLSHLASLLVAREEVCRCFILGNHSLPANEKLITLGEHDIQQVPEGSVLITDTMTEQSGRMKQAPPHLYLVIDLHKSNHNIEHFHRMEILNDHRMTCYYNKNQVKRFASTSYFINEMKNFLRGFLRSFMVPSDENVNEEARQHIHKTIDGMLEDEHMKVWMLAMTHSTYGPNNYETIETIGDAVYDAALKTELYRRFGTEIRLTAELLSLSKKDLGSEQFQQSACKFYNIHHWVRVAAYPASSDVKLLEDVLEGFTYALFESAEKVAYIGLDTVVLLIRKMFNDYPLIYGSGKPFSVEDLKKDDKSRCFELFGRMNHPLKGSDTTAPVQEFEDLKNGSFFVAFRFNKQLKERLDTVRTNHAVPIPDDITYGVKEGIKTTIESKVYKDFLNRLKELGITEESVAIWKEKQTLIDQVNGIQRKLDVSLQMDDIMNKCTQHQFIRVYFDMPKQNSKFVVMQLVGKTIHGEEKALYISRVPVTEENGKYMLQLDLLTRFLSDVPFLMNE